MMRSKAALASPSGAAAHTPAQTRIIEAALTLFAEQGIGGTSLQMIADAIGVTKAAVYHQYNTKDEIILAVAETVLAGLEAAVVAAEAERSRARARELLVGRMIDKRLVTRRRSQDDARTVQISLRSEGQALFRKLWPEAAKAQDTVAAPFSARELDTFKEMLRQIETILMDQLEAERKSRRG